MHQTMARIALLSALCLTAHACTPNKAYRLIPETCYTNMEPEAEEVCGKHAFQQVRDPSNGKVEYSLGFLELDDQGQFHSRGQLNKILAEIERIPDDAVVVIYFHGWKNNSAPGNSNVKLFRKALTWMKKLDALPDPLPKYALERKAALESIYNEVRMGGDDEHFKDLIGEALYGKVKLMRDRVEGGEEAFQPTRLNWQPRPVFGIYIGWRGLTLAPPILKESSFWGREAAAKRVASGNVTEALLKIEAAIEHKKTKAQEDAYVHGRVSRPATLVVIGHSLGASIAYEALSQIFVSRYIDSCFSMPKRDECIAKGYGDVVILLNPAVEALRYDKLNELFTDPSSPSFSKKQAPLLIILSSERDWVTKYAFRAGRFLTRLLQGEVTERDEKAKNITAIGHYAEYKTDAVLTWRPTAHLDCFWPSQLSHVAADVLRIHKWWIDQEEEMTFPFMDITLARAESARPFQPYRVVDVDGKIMPGHNSITECRTLGIIQLFVSLAHGRKVVPNLSSYFDEYLEFWKRFDEKYPPTRAR